MTTADPTTTRGPLVTASVDRARGAWVLVRMLATIARLSVVGVVRRIGGRP